MKKDKIVRYHKRAWCCPECGAICYCEGDIDDCLFNFPEDQAKCTHYKQPECSGYEGNDKEESDENS